MKHIIILSVLFLACNPAIINQGHGAKISGTGWLTRIEYKSADVLLTEAQSAADLHMQSTNGISIPDGGRVIVHYARPTLESADAGHFTIIIKNNEREIVRHRGESSMAYAHTDIGWNNLIVVDVPVYMPQFTVFVIDDVYKKRWQYDVNLN